MGSARRTRGIVGGLVGAVALLALVVTLASPQRVEAASYTCDEAGLNAALAAGGAATFMCAGPSTITITRTKTVSTSVTLDGGGLLTISGGNTYGVFAVNSGVTFGVANLTITGGNSANGGGIFNGGTVNITNSTLSGNSAGDGGGIFNGGTVNITNSTLSNNAASDGGGILNQGTVNLTNSTLAGNAAPYGGGIFNDVGSTTNVTNSTLSGNAASISGGGIYNNGGNGSVTLTGSIVAGNPMGGDTAGNPITDNGGNLLNLAAPLLAPLGSYGGPTQTQPPLPGSPAIDHGAATCTVPDPTGGPMLTTDQRGVSRPQGAKCDSGSVESAGFAFSSPTGTPQSIPAGMAFRTPLGVTITGNAVPGATGVSEPVVGGQVTFTGPTTGAGITMSPLTATITGTAGASTGSVSQSVTANGTLGSYTVTASAAGATGAATYTLTNMGACVVTSTQDPTDPGKLTLRDAVNAANAGACTGNAITVDTAGAFATPQTVTLTSALPAIAHTMTLDGSGKLTISGGGMYGVFAVNSGVTFGVANLTITGGNSTYGGGIYNHLGTLNVTNSTLSGNTAGSGGAILNGGTLNITNSTLSGNTAGNGGGIYNGGATVNVTNSTLSGNSAPYGGGLYNYGTVTVANSTLSGNSANSYGGGIYNGSNATVTLTNSTLSGNAASTNGGGIANFHTVNVTGSIIAGNSGGDTYGNPITDNGGNLIGGNPLLAPLGSYGGPTQTQPPLPGSPAIDHGAATCTVPDPTGGPMLTTDQRGVTRPQGAACDSGSVESAGFAFSSPTGGGQSANTGMGFPMPLTVTVTGNAVPGGGGVTEPVNGGVVTFTGPMSGASIATTPTTAAITGGVASAPVTANGTAGSYSVIASASGATGSASYTLTNTQAPAITSASGTSVTFGQAVAFTVTATGYPAPTFSAAGLPTGVLLNATTGALSGTPTSAGTVTVMLTASNGALPNATQPFTLTVNKATPAVTVTSSSAMTTSVVGTRVTFTATITGVAGTAPTGTVRFTSSDGTMLPAATQTAMGANLIATVTTSALTVGMDTLTARYSGDGTYLTAQGSVTQTVQAAQVTGLTVTAPTGGSNTGTATMPVLKPGGAFTLSVTGTYNNGTSGSVSPVMFTVTSGMNVVSVDSTGKVTALTGGTAVITVSGPNGTSTTITVTVMGASGAGLTAPQPLAHATAAPAVVTAAGTPQPQPGSHPAGSGGSGSGGSGAQPNAMGSETPTPAATPQAQAQPERHP